MVTCYLEYEIDPYKLEAFERYAKLWIPLVNTMGGKHHGYFLPFESGNTVAYLTSCTKPNICPGHLSLESGLQIPR